MRHFLLLAVTLIGINASSQHDAFTGNTTVTWQDCIQWFSKIDETSDIALLQEMGKTDIGKPLHLFVINKEKEFDPTKFNPKKTVILINNAIHPGEPDGVDASINFSREILDPANKLHFLLDSAIICIIPIYNIDGAFIRNGYSRTNQNGPLEYGFRGNAKNLDLNRDFIKCDSENAKSFSKIFHLVKPHIFIDTHVSNGADYQYVMTLISTQANKLGGSQAQFLKNQMEPELFERMAQTGYEMSPYVNHMGDIPETGIADFLETPRFASGYTALFQTLGFITETHMLKPYHQRVESTYYFFKCMLEYVYENNAIIIEQKENAIKEWTSINKYPLNFKLDTLKKEMLSFKGYEAIYENSLVGNGTRLRYDRNKPFVKSIPYFRSYAPEITIDVPKYYFVPQAWDEVVERLKLNNIELVRIEKDTTFEVSGYYLHGESTSKKPYEGHYVHSGVQAREEQMKILFFEGDYMVPTNQPGLRYIIETLEPRSVDSFFSWNFFDSVLQQKEWFSDYVFEEMAAQYLNENPTLKAEFEDALKNDPEMQEHWAQLYWIYRHSPHYEQSAFRYPIYFSK
jgi:hypothetical protein